MVVAITTVAMEDHDEGVGLVITGVIINGDMDFSWSAP